MRHLIMKAFLATALISLAPLTSYADDANATEAFKSGCLKAWMEGVDKSSDKVEYKNFGENYCDCASTKPLNNKTDIEKAAQVCMSQTLLHDAMNSIEDQEGLNDLTQGKIQTACQDKWKVIYPDLAGKDAEGATAYCNCAAPKLVELNNDSENMTDKDWDIKIDEIAGTCSGTVTPDKGTVNAKTTS